MDAADSAQPAVVKLLLEHGANANAACTGQWRPRWTPLYFAMTRRDEDSVIEVAKLLLDKGADINVRVVDYGTEGWTPLLAAMRQEQWKLARFLVERGADVNAQSAALGEASGFDLTPLMYAASAKEPEIGIFLLEKGARIETRTVTGRTALSFAAERGVTPFVEALLAAGANANDTDQGEFAPSGLDPESMELGPTGGQRREFPV